MYYNLVYFKKIRREKSVFYIPNRITPFSQGWNVGHEVISEYKNKTHKIKLELNWRLNWFFELVLPFFQCQLLSSIFSGILSVFAFSFFLFFLCVYISLCLAREMLFCCTYYGVVSILNKSICWVLGMGWKKYFDCSSLILCNSVA